MTLFHCECYVMDFLHIAATHQGFDFIHCGLHMISYLRMGHLES